MIGTAIFNAPVSGNSRVRLGNAVALRGALGARVVDQDLAHEVGRNRY
jgi:hypothetical protein